jgi:hypothetical protein
VVTFTSFCTIFASSRAQNMHQKWCNYGAFFVEQGDAYSLLTSVLESGMSEAVKHLRSRLAHE